VLGTCRVLIAGRRGWRCRRWGRWGSCSKQLINVGICGDTDWDSSHCASFLVSLRELIYGRIGCGITTTASVLFSLCLVFSSRQTPSVHIDWFRSAVGRADYATIGPEAQTRVDCLVPRADLILALDTRLTGCLPLNSLSYSSYPSYTLRTHKTLASRALKNAPTRPNPAFPRPLP
jgi:hypothetical protein